MDVITQLQLRQPNIYRASFNRPNLELIVRNDGHKQEALWDIVSKRKSEAGIIYCATRKEVERLWTFLNQQGVKTLKYHGGLNESERSQNQEDFIYDKANLMVATNAFGMGIDKSNVRYVIHYNMPKNIESYYQEIGRAGRDGLPSQCVLFYSPADVHTNKFLIEQGNSTEERKLAEYQKLQNMVDFAHTKACLRTFILNYFGENHSGNCNNCSNCNFQGVITDQTDVSKLIFACVKDLRRNIGVVNLVDTLKGAKTAKLKQLGLDSNHYYGRLSHLKKEDIKDMIYTLVAHGYLSISEGEYPVIMLAQGAMGVLEGEDKVLLKTAMPLAAKPEEDEELLNRFKALRLSIAVEEGIPSYMIFNDATLKDLAAKQPVALPLMLDVVGIGEFKLEKYGQHFLSVILQYRHEKGLSTAQEGSTLAARGNKRQQKTVKAGESARVTRDMLADGLSVEEVADERELAVTTILQHIQQLADDYDFPIQWGELYNVDLESAVLAAIKEVGRSSLRMIRDAMSVEADYNEIKVIILEKCILN